VFEACGLHVLDLILKHEFSAQFADKTTSSELSYSFVKDASKNWNKKRDDYLSLCSLSGQNHYADLPPTESRRKDYQFLLKHVKSVRFYRNENIRPIITNFPCQPPHHNLLFFAVVWRRQLYHVVN